MCVRFERPCVVVTNERGQYSIAQANELLPLGWRTVATAGDARASLAYIDAHWRDMRPQPARADSSPESARPGQRDRQMDRLGALLDGGVSGRADVAAIVVGEIAISYGDLRERSARLAALLLARGVGAEDSVAVMLPRGIDAVVAMLGILGAGAAYVPIDPRGPRARMSFMLRDASPKAVIASEPASPPVDNGSLVVTMAAGQEEDLLLRIPEVSDANLAYVLYTSGSSGRPKGVLIERGSLANSVSQTIRAYGLAPGARFLGFTAFTFDVSLLEVLCTVASGGTLFLATEEQRSSPQKLTDLIQSRQISLAELPPTMLAALEPSDLSELRVVISGGEPLPRHLAERWHSRTRRLINAYGPTEASIQVSLMEWSPSIQGDPPIGLPLPGNRLYVVDEFLRPVVAGSEGELAIGGVGLARGYLNLPGLTAERFRPDPFADVPGQRLYCTGDVVVQDEAGVFRFIGRTDRQIKLRGVRIELGEIEAILAEELDVSAVAVELAQTPAGHSALVAFIVGGGGVSKPIDVLASRLSPSMLPARIVRLPRLPTSSSQKVDHNLLREWAFEELSRSPHARRRRV